MPIRPWMRRSAVLLSLFLSLAAARTPVFGAASQAASKGPARASIGAVLAVETPASGAPTLSAGLPSLGSAALPLPAAAPGLLPAAPAAPAPSAVHGESAQPALGPSPAGVSPSVLPDGTQAGPVALPAVASPEGRPSAGAGEAQAVPSGSRSGWLSSRFQALRAAWALPRGADELPADAPAERIRGNVQGQLAGMSSVYGGETPLLRTIGEHAYGHLRRVAEHLRRGEIDPSVRIRTGAQDAPAPVVDRELRIGIYPVAADPFQWAHLLVGLQAAAELKLDKIVYVLAGDDPRKPQMTKVAQRHPMGQAVLSLFAPLFAYSPIAVGTEYDGETNMFRILSLNPLQKMVAYYIVGDDHYKVVDKKGRPDTIPKIEKNMTDPALDFHPKLHRVSLAFNEREGHTGEVPTSLEVRFLPKMAFEASSTLVRGGQYELMPFEAYEFVRKNGLGLYNIPSGDGASEKP